MALAGACVGDDVSTTGATETSSADTDQLLVDCMSAASALASELFDGDRECATVLRLRTLDLEVLGFQVVCGAAKAIDEAAARVSAAAALGAAPPVGELLGEPAGAYVFASAPGPEGGAAAVSVHSGLVTFAGTMLTDGTGEIVRPATWRDPAPIHPGCPAWETRPRTRGFDLQDGRELLPSEIDPVIAAVATTVVLAAYTGSGSLHDAVLLRYPPGPMPEDAEWVVAVQGGPWAP